MSRSNDSSQIWTREAVTVTCAAKGTNICDCDMVPVTNVPVSVTTFFVTIPDGGTCDQDVENDQNVER